MVMSAGTDIKEIKNSADLRRLAQIEIEATRCKDFFFERLNLPKFG
jgi:hypothetical protein